MTAGLIDSLIYVGSAIAGVAGGAILDGLGLTALYAAFILAGAAAVALCWISSRQAEKHPL